MHTAALLVATVVSVLGQANTQPFAGTWTADYSGRPIVRLELQTRDGAMTGSIQLANIHVDATGEVETVLSDLSARAPLIDVSVRNRTVMFARRDGGDTDHFELTMSDAGIAALLFVPSEADRKELADNGIPLPKPIRLTRIAR